MRIDEIKKELKSGVKKAAEDTKRQVLELARASINEFYTDYNPSIYNRTNQLINTIVDNGIKVRNIGAGFEIYFDSGMMGHPNPAYGKDHRWHKAEWSEEDILDNSFSGGAPHGGYPYATVNEPIWGKIEQGVGSQVGLNDLDIVIYLALQKAGIPVH